MSVTSGAVSTSGLWKGNMAPCFNISDSPVHNVLPSHTVMFSCSPNCNILVNRILKIIKFTELSRLWWLSCFLYTDRVLMPEKSPSTPCLYIYICSDMKTHVRTASFHICCKSSQTLWFCHVLLSYRKRQTVMKYEKLSHSLFQCLYVPMRVAWVYARWYNTSRYLTTSAWLAQQRAEWLSSQTSNMNILRTQ